MKKRTARKSSARPAARKGGASPAAKRKKAPYAPKKAKPAAAKKAAVKKTNKQPKATGVNRFKGADDVYETKRFIAVRRLSKNGEVISDTRRYYPKTAKNIKEASNEFGRLERR